MHTPSSVCRGFPDIFILIGCSLFLYYFQTWIGGKGEGNVHLVFLLSLSFWTHGNSQETGLKLSPVCESSSFPCKSVSGYCSWRYSKPLSVLIQSLICSRSRCASGCWLIIPHLSVMGGLAAGSWAAGLCSCQAIVPPLWFNMAISVFLSSRFAFHCDQFAFDSEMMSETTYKIFIMLSLMQPDVSS